MCGAPSTDGCTTTEVDDGEELASKADNSDRFTFVIIYTALLAAMYAAAKYCIKDQSDADSDPHDTPQKDTDNETDAVSAAMAAQVGRQKRLQTEPEAIATKEAADKQESSASVGGIAKLCGVVDPDTGEKLSVGRFWIRNHELLGLCFDDKAHKADKVSLGGIQAKGSRFKNASFVFGLCFTISIALMFQSVSIAATTQMESTNCYENDGAGTISTIQDTTVNQGGGGGYSFGDVGGPKVVVLCTLFKQVEGFLGKKIQEAYKTKAAFKEYLRFGVLIHLIGFVVSVVLGVSGADASKSAPYVQRYCDAEDPGADDEGSSMVGIYVQAVLATQVAEWFIGSNIQLSAKYCIGSWCMDDDGIGAQTEKQDNAGEGVQTNKQPQP